MDGRRKFPLEIAWEQAGRELEEEMRQRAGPQRHEHTGVRDHEAADGPISVRGHDLRPLYGGLEVQSESGGEPDC